MKKDKITELNSQILIMQRLINILLQTCEFSPNLKPEDAQCLVDVIQERIEIIKNECKQILQK